jgi:hypothetical protein
MTNRLTAAEYFVEDLGVAFEIFKHFRRRESRLDTLDQAGLLGRRVGSIRNSRSIPPLQRVMAFPPTNARIQTPAR